MYGNISKHITDTIEITERERAIFEEILKTGEITQDLLYEVAKIIGTEQYTRERLLRDLRGGN